VAMDEKIVCPHCQYQYQRDEISETISSGKYLCFLSCGKRFSEYPNHGSKLRSLSIYQRTETFFERNRIASLIIILTSFIFLAIGITIFTSENRYFKIAMNSTDPKEIESVVGKISDMKK
jgi:ABC-type Fe3+ transport system permease subunit